MSQQALHHAKQLVAREKLDFGLDGELPRWWYDNNPYKSRLVDALQASFPDGERHFITSVRDFRSQVADPKLAAEIKVFMRQEGQHGIVHSEYNQRLREQGMDVDAVINYINDSNARYTQFFSKHYMLALTAAFEHFTAMLAEIFFEKKETLKGAHPKLRSVLAWHAVEEMEHKAVAFDLMQSVAKVGYMRRCGAMLHVTFFLTLLTLRFTNHFLRNDGFSAVQRSWMMAKACWWLFGFRGLISSHLGSLFAYFKPGFHPWQQAAIHNYDAWVEAYDRTGDPMQAGAALYQAAH